MRRILQTLGVMGTLLFFPISIKTQWNNCLPCDGQIAWAELPTSSNTANLIFPDSFTLEGWLYLNQADAPALLLSLRTEDGRLIYRLGKEIGQRFYFELGDAQGKMWRAMAHALVAAGEWIHVAGVLQKDDNGPDILSLYVNGRRLNMAQQETELSGQGVPPQSCRLRLAGEPDAQMLSGRLDEVRISSTARYTEPLISSMTNTFSIDAATVALWHFDEPFGSPIVADVSGKGLDLALVGNNIPWSVRLEDFTAKRYGAASLLLAWKTSNEREVFGIEVQRRNALENFACIGFLPAHGTGDQQFSYNFTDMPEKNGRYYYRLKMLNSSGHYRFSPEVGVDFVAELHGFRRGESRPQSPEPPAPLSGALVK